ncbi:hypothetical protein H2204_008296 [Knufia peltigerae]|nr:hypothetical protein H2204_008296 [Knufia peltigerae]
MSMAPVDRLARVNQKLGNFPLVKMADGQTVPTGTVATLLFNIRAYDQLLKENTVDDISKKAELEKLEGEIKDPVPLLINLGMFELFSPDEWCAGGAGRQLVGRTAKGLMPAD